MLSPPFVLLEDRLTPGSAARLYEEPVELVRCDEAEGVATTLARLERALAGGLHVAGSFAYELGHVLECRLTAKLPPSRSTPLIDVGLFRRARTVGGLELDLMFASLGPPPPIEDLRPGRDRRAHVALVRRVLAAIEEGRVYQANLTFPMHFTYLGDPLRLYGALRVRQPTAHAAIVALGREWTLSASPELFVRVRDGGVLSRPMKGTVARAGDPAADLAAAAALQADPKQRAENVMIVDLIRNDLSRIAVAGSVKVPEALTLETYPDLHALTSTVAARLRPGVNLSELLSAVFPCGSVVGAPKIAAADLLSDVEGAERGVYTGAIGAIAPNGDMELNVAIRTLRLSADGASAYGVGGGIVADSDPDAEYDEALLKARLLEDLAREFELIETLRWSRTAGLVRGEAHLDRLQASARALAFRFDRTRCEADLARRTAAWTLGASTDRRVRLQLRRDGALTIEDVEVTTVPSSSLADAPVLVGVAGVRLDAGSPFNRHKTTFRSAYDAAAAEAVSKGWGEAILLNRAGRVADAARHTVFAEIEGRFVTPPLTSGALPGVLRADLLQTRQVVEAELDESALRTAQAVFIGNSLWGLKPATLTRSAVRP